MKPIIKLFDKTFTLVAIIDDYQGASFEHNLYQAGTFTITINYNIPNAKLFERGLFVQFGDNPYDFGEIISVNNTIGSDGKGSEFINVTGYDARYLFKRRVIKNLNNNDTWSMTAKGELCMRNLVADQCGTNAETKRQLPIINTIPLAADAIGSTYSVSESFSNLYDVLVTIATQSEIGWAVLFENGTLTLHVYKGSDLSSSVQFSTDFESLANGNYKDSSESFANSIYIGGKGTGSERDIYEGEDGTPEGIDRFEAYDNQSSMTTEDEYEAEALSMLSQYGQTVSMSGAGLAKCPYIFREQYNIGDIIKLSFSGKSASVQILSVTEVWQWNRYGITFNFGKPVNTINEQLNLMLRKIQEASNKNKACESVKWYNVATDTAQSASEVIFNTIGFTGAIPSGGRTFTLYRDDEGTGAKSYTIYTKNLTAGDSDDKLTLTTGVTGKTSVELKAGDSVARILVDEEGNIIFAGLNENNITTEISEGNNNIPTSDAVNSALSSIGASVPTGTMFIYGGSVAPDGWLVCDGSAISRSTYAELFSVIGTSYGVGDGSTTFNLPDMRDRFAQGASTNHLIGTKLEAGLPNIKGFFGDLDRWRGQLNNANALNELGISKNTFFNMTSRLYKDGKSGDAGVIDACGFDASRASSIYGKSNTVQPPAVCVNYIIKY